MARRNDHSREELEKLALKTAIEIVKKDGPKALTARRLAQDIGYTPGTLYNIFGSMEGLCFRINGETLDRLYKFLTDPSAYKTDITENVKIMARKYMDFARGNKALWLLMFDPFVSQEDFPGWYREKVKNEFAPLEDLIAPLFKNERDKKRAARVIWSSVHGICLTQIAGKISLVGDDDAAAMADYLVENFIAGLKA